MHRPVFQISRIGPLEPFGHTQFRHFTIASLFSFSAFFVQMLVRGWLVNDLTRSPLLVSLVPVLYIAPMLIFTLVGGELADRFRRTRIVATGELIVFGTYAALAALTLSGVEQAWHVLLLTGIHGVTSSMYAPARQTLVGDLVRLRLQRAALGLSPAVFNLAQIVGPLFGGLVLATAGAGAASLLGALLILPAIPIYASLKPVAKSTTAHQGSFVQNMREGARYIFRHKTLRWYLVAGFAMVITVNTWGALFPPLATEVLRQGGGGLATLQVSIGIGSLFGAVTSMSFAARFGEKRLSVAAGLTFAALVGGLAISDIFLLSVVIAGVAASVATLYFVTNMVTMQLTASPEYRSRVISVRFIMFGFGPFGMIVVGSLAQFLGTQWALGISAISGATLLLGITLFMKTGDTEDASVLSASVPAKTAAPELAVLPDAPVNEPERPASPVISEVPPVEPENRSVA